MHYKCKHIGLLVLRLAAGLIFIVHGYGKLFGGNPGMAGFTGMVGKMGFPLPSVFAYIAALTEFVGGFALVLGIGTQIVAALLAIVMLVAFVAVKKFSLPAGDPDLALLAIVIALFNMGPGHYSLAHLMFKGCNDANGLCKGGTCEHMPSDKMMDKKEEKKA